MSEATFQRVASFLIAFVTKDKQIESLADKLSHRLAAATEPRHWRDIAYCLSQLATTDRALAKVAGMLASFKEQLGDAAVYDSLSAFAARSRKVAKPEMKAVLEDFEVKTPLTA